MNALQRLLANADLLADLCEQIADHCRRNPGGSWEEVRIGIGHIIRRRTSEEWDDSATQFRGASAKVI